jgi:RNA polymerase sigma-70 factor (ECF subfamily)
MALLVLLQHLTPEERIAFLLHEVFEQSHSEIGLILGKAEPTCRQLLHRARKRIHAGRPRFKVSDERCRSVVTSFLAALRSDDYRSLMMLMSEDATLASDSGGRVRATLKVIQGNDRIARLLIGVKRKRARTAVEKMMLINGDLGIVTYVDERPVAVYWFEVTGRKITRVYRILNPDKLKGVPALEDKPPDTSVHFGDQTHCVLVGDNQS